MYKKFLLAILTVVLAFGVVACGSSDKKEDQAADQKKEEPKQEAPKEDAEKKEDAMKEDAEKKEEPKEEAKKEEPVAAEKPGESGFAEISIGEEQKVGPFNVAAVYFQPVDMIPAGKNPTKEESDMHLEADIHLQDEFAKEYGFGSGDNIWPAYLTVKYEVMDKDGKVVADGSFMPMNADDGPHYGANIKKGLLTVGQYKLKLIIEPPTDYLLHVDEETGVPAKQKAEEYFKTHTAEFDWNYTAEQLQNE